MTRKEIFKDFFAKTVLTVIIAAVLFGIFRTIFSSNGIADYMAIAIGCGIPFGIRRMFVWLVPVGHDIGGTMGIIALNFMVGGVIGVFILAWRLLVAAWYIPLTVFRLVKFKKSGYGNNVTVQSESELTTV